MREVLAFAVAGLLALPALAIPTEVVAEYLISTNGITIGRGTPPR